MADSKGELEVFRKKADFSHQTQSLKPAWLRESGEAVDADRVFIWGKGARQRPHINGSGQRPSLQSKTPYSILSAYISPKSTLNALGKVHRSSDAHGIYHALEWSKVYPVVLRHHTVCTNARLITESHLVELRKL